MMDETWARLYKPKLKCQSNDWHHYGSPQKSKVDQNPTNVEAMVILVNDWNSVILKHTILPSQYVNV